MAIPITTGQPLEVVSRRKQGHGDAVLASTEPHQCDHQVDRTIHIAG